MIKNIVDWLKFSMENPREIGSYYEELQRVFNKEVSICTVSDGDGSDVHAD